MYELDKSRFGAFVADRRKEKGLTQKQLAEKLYISDKAVSKWETGASVPDITLLVPLAEILEVTVTELLLGERVEENEKMEAGQVEQILKTAAGCSQGRPLRAYAVRSRWPLIWILALLAGTLGMIFCKACGVVSPAAVTGFALSGIFGAYFVFFVPVRLPAFYDEHPFSFFCDGPFRMNLPGVVFNNSNWPYIVRAVRVWGSSALAFWPYNSLAVGTVFGPAEYFLFFILFLGGLFVPVWYLARKYM